ncbi:MAG: cytochrome c1, partial [Pseudomonadota bacterium]
AEMKSVEDGPNEDGEMFQRPARPSDNFVNPWPNEAIAKAANNGAVPPDLSVIVKARSGGADYIYSLLTGYPSFDDFQYDDEGNAFLIIEDEEHEGHTNKLIQPSGLNYNPYFPGDTSAQFDGDPRHVPYGGFLAMAPPLLDDILEYKDGTPATVENMARDVTAFLAWASDPKQTTRKQTGLAVMAYLLILAILLWFSYKRIWRNVDH